MNFPSEEPVTLPNALTSGGMSGPRQVQPAERLPALDTIPTKRLEQLHDEMGALACLEPDGPLKDYMLLVEMQCGAELVRRMNK